MKAAHPIHSRDADKACRWLCLSAGQRTAKDDLEIAEALRGLPFCGQAIKVPEIDMLGRVK